MREPRLGDDIDDFCVRCKRIMNHAVVSVLNGEPAKVRCRTCHSDHDFRHEQAPPPKVDARKAALFNEVLKKVDPADAKAVEDVDAVDIPDLDEAVETADTVDDPPVEADVEPEPAPAPAPKAKARGRARK
jgi:hypothetical protein